LTSREREVLKLIADGHTDRRIGELLFISLRTVQRHRFNIRTKLNLKHTAELVKYAIARGYTNSVI
jgi:DNA-binding NarL/FixJ family response regulator